MYHTTFEPIRFRNISMESSVSSTDSESDFDFDIRGPAIGRDPPNQKEVLIEKISKRKRDIRGATVRIRRFKTQRDSFHTMMHDEEVSKNRLIQDANKLEKDLVVLTENEKSKSAREELEKTDAWKLVDNCICGDRLLHGVGEEGYGVVSFSCNCTCNRVMHFKCVLSVRESKCPWCRSSMLFGDAKKKMNNNPDDSSYFDLVNTESN